MLKEHSYRSILLPLSLIVLLMSAFAWYAIGVVDRNSCEELSQLRFDRMEQAVAENMSEQNAVAEELQQDYQTRARVAAMMIANVPDMLQNETSFEELRIAMGAEEISVSDEKGSIVWSTNPSLNHQMVRKEFLEAADSRESVEWVLTDDQKIQVGTSRLDTSGVLQLTFAAENFSSLLKASQLSTITENSPFMVNGTLSIVNQRTFRYESHTDVTRVGTLAPFSLDDFPKEYGKFLCNLSGKRVLTCYRQTEDYLYLCTIPVSEVYERRNAVVPWMLFLGVMLIASAALSVSSRLYAQKDNLLILPKPTNPSEKPEKK